MLLLLHDAPAPDAETAERLAARSIAVVPGPVAAVEVTDDALTGVRLADGRVVALDAIVVATRLTRPRRCAGGAGAGAGGGDDGWARHR